MSIKALSEYTFQSRYSQYNHEKGRKETWEEAVARIFEMHRTKYAEHIAASQELGELIDFAEEQYKKRRVLGSQRALQFGGAPILQHNARLFNCTGQVVNNPKVFEDIVFVLMMGCGAGYSVQKHHIDKLPKIAFPNQPKKTFVIPDTCEGWAESVGVLLSSYFISSPRHKEYCGYQIEFDGSNIRPKGSLIANRFKAPGPDSLLKGLEKIRKVLDSAIDNGQQRLTPLNCHDIICHAADFVVSGGVRRAALLSLFDKDDKEMAACKTGPWFRDNPQRARSNNSVVLKRSETTFEEFNEIAQNIKQMGEPGFYFVDDDEYVSTNPCCEIGFWNQNEDGTTGTSVCNLVDINGRYSKTKEDFLSQCKVAAVIGTLQAGYTDFPFLGESTETLIRKERLLGCSITGWMDNPEVLFNEQNLVDGVKIIKDVNKRVAKLIGITPGARLNCTKPAGSTSTILGTSSGVHMHHAKRYIRRVQSNTQDHALTFFKKYNAHAVEKSVWSANDTDEICAFPCEVAKGAITKNQIGAIQFLEKIKFAQKHWVIPARNDEYSANPNIDHNISNTCTVLPEEWSEVIRYIYDNREYFSGISLLPSSGDLDYPQAPFSTVLTPNELVKEYGDASVFASGLVVDGLAAFNNNLWEACDSALGIGEVLAEHMDTPEYPATRNYRDLASYFDRRDDYDNWWRKTDWIRRIKQFADRYFDGNLRRATYCCKHVSLWKTWCDLRREYKEVPWEEMECEQEFVEADTLAAQACSGGACEIL